MPFVRPQKPHGVSEAYALLELDEGAPLDVIKSTYKKLSLRIHPDKNPDDPNATQQFQKISEAYRVLLQHLDNDGGSNESDYDDDYADEEYMYELYRRLFEMVMRDEEHTFYARAHRSKPRREEETPEQHRARIQKHLDEQKAGEERRRKERLQLKARRAFEREQERCEAEERRRIRNSDKKAAAKIKHQKDIETKRKRQEASQRLRSAVFAAARKRNVSRVEQGIWEEHVDAAGGEVKDGCHDFVKAAPADPQETLLHIAAGHGDHGLVRWLDGHGAEPEERDSAGLTAFHVALQRGRVSVVAYFFDEHPPDADSANIYDPPSSTSLLSLAIESLEPEVVWMILDQKLVSKEVMDSVWKSFVEEEEKLAKKAPTKKEGIKDIKRLLAHYGGFGQHTTSFQEEKEKEQSLSQSLSQSKNIIQTGAEFAHKKENTVRGQQSRVNGRGRDRGCGRGRGLGRGLGRGRGPNFVLAPATMR